MQQRHVHVNSKYNVRYRTGEVVSLAQYIYYALDGSSHDTGALEAVDATTNNACRLLTRVIVKLYDKGLLTLEDIPELLDNADKLTAAKEPKEPETKKS